MGITHFFEGIYWERSTFPNFYVVGKGSAQHYVCSYDNKNNGAKSEIMKILGVNSRDFDFHHIVEKQHIADISHDGKLDTMYYMYMPTVLIHNREHHSRYNSILHAPETRHIYIGKEGKNPRTQEKQRAAMKLTATEEKRKELRVRGEEMKKLYVEVYSDRSLGQIAMNVIDYYLKKI